MSIKDLVEGVKNLLNELKTLMSDLLTSAKEFCSWLYNREWTVGELVIIVVGLAIAFVICRIEDKLKKKGKQDEPQKDKQDKKPGVLQGISKTEKEICLKDLKRPKDEQKE